MIKDSHPWPRDVKAPVQSYDDLRRANYKVTVDGASFNQSKLPPMIAITALTHMQAYLFICGEHRGIETSYSSLKTQNKNQNKKTPKTHTSK